MTETATVAASRYGKATDLGFDASDGPWVAVCNRHNAVVNVASRDRARDAAKLTAAFCEDCASMDSTPEYSDDEPEAVFPPARHLDPEPDADEERHPYEDGSDLGALPPLDDLLPSDPEPDAQPILGTYFGNGSGIAHNAVSMSGAYFRAVCGPSMMMGEPTTVGDPAMCTYCLAGVPAPEGKPVKERTVRIRRVPAEKMQPAPEPEPKYDEEIGALDEALTDLLITFDDDRNLADIHRAVEILEPGLAKLKAMLPRRRVGVRTGARSGLVKQSQSVNPSAKLEEAKAYAAAGDTKAQQIVEHAAIYQPGVDCPWCIEHHGKMTRHGYATAFCSIGRELDAMKLRSAAQAALAS